MYVFIVSDVRPTIPITYQIKYLKGEDIKGSFYQQELQKSKQEIYRIDKVLKNVQEVGRKKYTLSGKDTITISTPG